MKAKRGGAQQAQAVRSPRARGAAKAKFDTAKAKFDTAPGKAVSRAARGADPRDPRRRSEGRRSEGRRAEGRRNEAPGRKAATRPAETPTRSGRAKDPRALQHGPATSPIRRPVRPKNASQAKARAKARKAKAPKVVRLPLRERLLTRIGSIDLNPRTLAARVPFVVLVIGALGLGLGVTLWLSTDAAERSYQLGAARSTNQSLLQQKEALERDVLEAQAAPALAEAARNLGMIPSKDTAHLVLDPAGNWIVIGDPKPAEGMPPAPLNFQLPDETPIPAAAGERPVRAPVTRPIPTIPGPAAVAAPAPPVPPVIGPIPTIPGPAAVPTPIPTTPGPAAAATPLAAGPEVLVRQPAPAAGAPLDPALAPAAPAPADAVAPLPDLPVVPAPLAVGPAPGPAPIPTPGAPA